MQAIQHLSQLDDVFDVDVSHVNGIFHIGHDAPKPEPLMSWVAEALQPHLRQVNPLSRVGVSVYPHLRRLIDVHQQTGTFPRQIRGMVGPRLDIELLTDTIHATAYAVDALAARLGIGLPSAGQLGDDFTLDEPYKDGGPDAAHNRVQMLRAA